MGISNHNSGARGLLRIFGVLVLINLLAVVFLPTYVGGKPTTRDLAKLGCKAYLAYAKYAATNGKFRFDNSNFLQYAETNYNFSQAGISYHSTTGFTNEAAKAAAIRYVELYNSLRSIFNTNQEFWAKTNFQFQGSSREVVVLCQHQFFYPRSKNYFGCSYSHLKPAFAVGYSDGTTGLISQEQFVNLNLNSFASLSSLGLEGFHVRFQ